mgnify:CR=1 FL=1
MSALDPALQLSNSLLFPSHSATFLDWLSRCKPHGWSNIHGCVAAATHTADDDSDRTKENTAMLPSTGETTKIRQENLPFHLLIRSENTKGTAIPERI